MRKHISTSSYSSYNNCNSTPYEGCSFTGTNRPILSSSSSFTSCLWSKCEAESGGGIYVDSADIQLEVYTCQFLSCKATVNNGSGICARSSSRVHVNRSHFYDCNALTSHDGSDGGGGIYLSNISTEALITSTHFISCIVKYDGGGVALWYSYSKLNNNNTMQDCVFLNCSGNNQSVSEGGGSRIFYNNYNVGISNTLFSQCSNYRGGGLEIELPLTVSTPVISFCLFHVNTAVTSGKDIYLQSCDNNPFLHSFTISSGHNRVTPEHWNETTNQDEWLPLTKFTIIRCRNQNLFRGMF